jgi:hypothetical protein
MENKGGNLDYYKYKQGVWYMKSDDVNDPDYQANRTFKDIAGNDVKVSGVFVNGMQGIVTDISVYTSDDGTYEVLNVVLDNKEKLSMSLPSEASRQVVQTFANLDFTEPVNLVAWTKDEWYKLSIKQDGKHVENSFFEFKDKKFGPKAGSEYPVKPTKDSPTYKKDKVLYDIDEVEFLKTHIEKIKALIPEAKEEVVVEETPEVEDKAPEEAPF